jgi:phage gp36-like protein
MPYATFDDVLRRYNPLNTMIGSGPTEVSTIDISSVFIPDAEGYVNAFLGARYAIPVGVEPLITQITCDLAICKIISDRAPRLPDFMANRCTNANSLLGMLRDGKMVLTGSGTLPVTGGVGDQEVWSNVLPEEGFAGPIFRPTEANSWAHVRGPFLPSW